MAAQSPSVSRLDVSRVLLATVDRLAREFPDVAPHVVYEKVGAAREVAERRLPDLDAYAHALEREARALLQLEATMSWREVSAGTSGAQTG
jgi:hypothetical protein